MINASLVYFYRLHEVLHRLQFKTSFWFVLCLHCISKRVTEKDVDVMVRQVTAGVLRDNW